MKVHGSLSSTKHSPSKIVSNSCDAVCHAVCHALLCLVLPVYCDCDTVTIVDSSDSSMLLRSQAGNSIYIDWLGHLHILWILWPRTPNCDLIFDSYKIYPPSTSFWFLQNFILFGIITPLLPPHLILSHPKHKHYQSDKILWHSVVVSIIFAQVMVRGSQVMGRVYTTMCNLCHLSATEHKYFPTSITGSNCNLRT